MYCTHMTPNSDSAYQTPSRKMYEYLSSKLMKEPASGPMCICVIKELLALACISCFSPFNLLELLQLIGLE